MAILLETGRARRVRIVFCSDALAFDRVTQALVCSAFRKALTVTSLPEPPLARPKDSLTLIPSTSSSRTSRRARPEEASSSTSDGYGRALKFTAVTFLANPCGHHQCRQSNDGRRLLAGHVRRLLQHPPHDWPLVAGVDELLITSANWAA